MQVACRLKKIVLRHRVVAARLTKSAVLHPELEIMIAIAMI